MVIIRFPNEDAEIRGLGFLARRFSGKTFANGDTIVSEKVLPYLAAEGIEFSVTGRATYERVYASLRNSAATAIQ